MVLCECESRSLTLRNERGLKVLENTVLRRIFGPKGENVMRGWRSLRNQELLNLYSLKILFQ
jgi:hypothetical protein